eukprot:SAG11_NODE_14923_length_595_cov_0.725806_1_plen_35_part_10
MACKIYAMSSVYLSCLMYELYGVILILVLNVTVLN